MKKMIFLTLIGVCLLLAGCTYPKAEKETKTSKWSWPCKPKEPAAAYSPCAAPVKMAKETQCFPVGEGRAISLEKMAPTEVRVNEPFDYQIKVTNLTDRTLQNVLVKDRIPANMAIKSSAPKADISREGNVQWMLGALEPKASRMISINAVAEGTGAITSCAEVTYDSPICARIDVVESKLQLAKYAPAESLMCDRIPLRYVISNTGNGYACDITVKDTLQEGFMTSEGKNEVMFNIASLAPGKSQELKVMVDAHKTGTLSSTAAAMSKTSGTASSNATTTMISQPVLAISEKGPDSQYVGKSLVYEITVSNKGNAIAKDTILEVSVPDNVSFSSATEGGRFTRMSPGKVSWNIGQLMPNSTKKVSLVVMSEEPGTVTTTAIARAYCAESATDSVKTTVSGIPGILMEVVDQSDPVMVGENETYVITVTNQGSATDTNIKISCMLEDTMQYVSSSGPTNAAVEGNSITFAALPSLAPKAQAKWLVNVKSVGEGDVRFKTVMTTDQLQRDVEETEATRFYK